MSDDSRGQRMKITPAWIEMARARLDRRGQLKAAIAALSWVLRSSWRSAARPGSRSIAAR